MIKKHKYYVRASFTLEAAAIYPFTIILIFSFIFLAFFLHDKTLAHAKLMKTVYMTNVSLSEKATLEDITKYSLEDLEKHTFTESTFYVDKQENSENTYLITTYHNNTFLPYIDKVSESSVTLPDAEICRKINYYQSLYLVAKGE